MLRFMPKNAERREIPETLRESGVPDQLLCLMLDRGIDTNEKIGKYLHPKMDDLYDPMLMQDMDKAVAVIRDAISRDEEIVVFGDYDVDGVTATAILLTYLRKQGAKVGYYIPDRHGEGYGLNIAAVEQIASHAKLLITVDCGITCPVEVARANELGMRVIVHTRTKKLGFGDVEFVSREELFARSDVISLHCPLTEQTKGMIDSAAIAGMRDHVCIINTARGPLVDEQAMADALASGKVSCYMADVLSCEPARKDNPLLSAPNAIITPHVAWAPKETRRRLLDIAVGNVRAYIAGTPRNVVS